ncbi:diacylglycerol/lipid kinase family protein [Nocardioides caldifontis]|uniref:diacylglycerol/lipid kinase family protein n=1 Tax=Nocardioides caldifontis TaxID=2588938 RepID=UPI001EF0F932|nr:diacylglycerol kinase family protein [Nocardioides caldifontis]
MDDIVLVANANAGTHEQEALAAALEVLRKGASVEVVETSSPDELDEVCARLDGRVLVVAGGDGSLHAVVNALHRSGTLRGTRLGLVPLGTGNDFARGVGIPLEPEQAAEVITSDRLVPVDLAVDDAGTVVVNNAHLGVGAEASRAADKWKPRLGRIGYALGALSAGYDPKFLKVTVTVDGRAVVRRRRVAQVAIGNGSSVGGGTELIPGADPADGELVIIVSRARGRLRRFAYVARLRTGKHHLMREVDRTSGCEVVVEGEPFYVISDGEISEQPFRRRSWKLEAGAVQMYLPEREPRPAPGSTPAD